MPANLANAGRLSPRRAGRSHQGALGGLATRCGGALGALQLILAVPAAAAPEQTVEGAQQFLATALVGASYDANQWTIEGRPADRGELMGVIRRIATQQRCLLTYDIDYPAGEAGGFIFEAQARTDARWPMDQVSEVKTVGADIQIYFGPAGRPRRLRIASDTLRARIAYAWEFLRISCDKTRDTGF